MKKEFRDRTYQVLGVMLIFTLLDHRRRHPAS